MAKQKAPANGYTKRKPPTKAGVPVSKNTHRKRKPTTGDSIPGKTTGRY